MPLARPRRQAARQNAGAVEEDPSSSIRLKEEDEEGAAQPAATGPTTGPTHPRKGQQQSASPGAGTRQGDSMELEEEDGTADRGGEHDDDEEDTPFFFPTTTSRSTLDPDLDGDAMEEDEDKDGVEREEEEDDDDDDEVLYEMDVFQAPSPPAAPLHVFQFPSTATASGSAPAQASSTFKLKRGVQRFQYITPVPRDAHFNEQQAALFGRGADDAPLLSLHDHQLGRPEAAHALLDSIQYTSKLLPKQCAYKVGIMREDGLYLADVDLLVQMRPSLEYIDRIHEKEKAASNRMVEVHGQEGKLVQQLIVSSEDKEATRKAALAEHQKRADLEPWRTATVHEPNTLVTKEFLDLVFTAPEVSMPALSEGSRSQYLDRIQSGDSRLDGKPAFRLGMTLKQMSLLPVEDQLLGILMNSHVASLETLARLLPSFTEPELVTGLRRVAVSVAGTWVVRSEYLYSGTILQGRRYLLSLFQQGPVRREAFSRTTQLPGTIVFNMLSELATLTPEGWRLKCVPGFDPARFAAAYPSQAAEQERIVVTEGEQARAHFVEVAGATARSGTVIKGERASAKRPVPLARLSAAQHHAPAAGGADALASPIPNGNAGPPSGNKAAATPKDELYLAYRQVVWDLFSSSSAPLKRKDVMEGVASSSDMKPIPPALYTRVMNDLATCKNGAWTLKPEAR